MRYTTITDVIDQAVAPALGEYTDDYDLEGIARAAFEYTVDTDADGNELLNTAGFVQVVDEAGFWAIADQYDTTKQADDEDEATGFTAWLTTQADMTLNGEYCEVNVIEDEATGGPEPMAAVQLPVTATADCDDEAARDVAETALLRAGWTTAADCWEQYDHGYTIAVRRRS